MKNYKYETKTAVYRKKEWVYVLEPYWTLSDDGKRWRGSLEWARELLRKKN